MCTQNELIPDDHQPAVVEHVVHVHLSVGQFSKEFQQKLRRSNHVTPKNYLDFISSYTKLLKEKDKYICDQCSRLSGGLTKLNEASEQIKVLNDQLEVQKVAVTEKSASCEALLTDISSKQEIGTRKKQEAEKKSEEIEEQNKVCIKTLICTGAQLKKIFQHFGHLTETFIGDVSGIGTTARE